MILSSSAITGYIATQGASNTVQSVVVAHCALVSEHIDFYQLVQYDLRPIDSKCSCTILSRIGLICP